ncbi:MAG: alpha/beta fold hydrolase [Halobacteriales archaeon]
MPTRHTVPVDGEEVVAVHHGSDGERWMFFSHGFVSDKSGYAGRCERAVNEGYDAVRFDHRGCGESSRPFGDQNLTTRIADLRAVVEYFGAVSPVVFGSSFGGKVAFHAVAGELSGDVEAVVARSPVTYNEPMERYRTEQEGTGVADAFFEDLDGYGFETVEENLDVPVAVFHGRDDEVVDVRHSFDAVRALGTDAVVEAYAGEGHRFSRDAEARLRDRLFGWLSTATDGA